MKLVLENIEKSFGEKKVLKKASAEFENGKIYGLLGRNGAGKTTILNCINGELKYDGGRIVIFNNGKYEDINYSDVGYIFSEPVLPEFLTGYEFLKFYIDINKDNINNLRSIDEYFDTIKIYGDDRYRLIKDYSEGMKNKLQMICTFITKPPIILMDEPLTSLDVVAALEMKKFIRELKEERIIIFSTHILQLAMDLCDEIVTLNNGTLEQINHELIKSGEFEATIMDILGDKSNE
ncbi:ABC transporter ATP-binding protein [Tissierella sp. MB52-C2]|uniref:ABC transporter ATP-binding protein n=1 Tax=Tissierella sp. MB52-C2 TaxID=3070999 RepID=UPI00280AA82C|nr:ABC transporter ATP-binding protein [Tissierella sp. MB52-C2]WMM26108.1 ABC transporter ATP-binding protein [Tissierella sp. MB52-C2]